MHPKHLQVMVYEAPNFEAMLAFSAEPAIAQMMNFYTSDMWVAEPFSDMVQRWSQAK